MDTADRRSKPTPVQHSYRLGRGLFLGLTGIGAAALFAGKSGIFSLDAVSKLNLVPGATNVDGFTIYTVTGGYPSFRPGTYRLRIDGMVKNPLTLSIDDILHEHAITETRFYQCVTGWTVPRATWTGIRLSRLLDRVQPHPEAQALKFYSFDGSYTESLTMEQARHPDVLLAYKLHGKPLSRAQGAPLRLVVPGMYGYKFIKWLDRVELIPHAVDGFWEKEGYDRNAYIGHSNGTGA